MTATRSALERLQLALDERRLVRIARSLPFADDDDVYILAIGAKWFLTVKVVDGGYFDGFHAMRMRDVKKVSRKKFFDEQLSTQLNVWPPELPAQPIDLDSTSSLLATVGANDVIFGVEKERQRRAMWIGVLHGVHEGTLWLRELDVKARWGTRPVSYKLSKITSVSWGGRYMGALELSAGERPAYPPRLEESATQP